MLDQAVTTEAAAMSGVQRVRLRSHRGAYLPILRYLKRRPSNVYLRYFGGRPGAEELADLAFVVHSSRVALLGAKWE